MLCNINLEFDFCESSLFRAITSLTLQSAQYNQVNIKGEMATRLQYQNSTKVPLSHNNCG